MPSRLLELSDKMTQKVLTTGMHHLFTHSFHPAWFKASTTNQRGPLHEGSHGLWPYAASSYLPILTK